MADTNTVYPFVQAKHFTPANRTSIDWIVVHDMESLERADTAEGCARYFATTSTKASAHACADVDSIVECVRDKDVAWHAPGANRKGLGLEHAGVARQTAAQWADPYSEAMLHISAAWTAQKCKRWNIPVRYVDAAGLRRGDRGITTHDACSKAFGGTHWDPGPNFPMAHFIALVRFYAGQAPTVPAPPIPNKVWKLGSTGPAVGFLQGIHNVMVDAGYTPGPKLTITDPAGFGPKTEAAVRRDQTFFRAMQVMAGEKNEAKLVDVDGKVGPQTLEGYAYWGNAAGQKVAQDKCARLAAAGKAVGKS